jgi:hypothetical protein
MQIFLSSYCSCNTADLREYSPSRAFIPDDIYNEQGEELLRKIISIFQEDSESLQHFSGIYDPIAILQNLPEQDRCFDSKDLIDLERNAVDLYIQRDRTYVVHLTSSASKMDYLKTIYSC